MPRYSVVVIRFGYVMLHAVVALPAGLTLATPTSETQEFNFEYPPLQPGPTPVSAQSVMFTEAGSVAANPLLPVRSQGKYSSWHVQSRLAEGGGGGWGVNGGRRHSLLTLCQCVPYGKILDS